MLFKLFLLIIFFGLTSITNQAQSSIYIPVVSQRFEGGEMIYRQDNGDIYIISNSSGRWWRFDSTAYGGLSVNQATAPMNRISPINGFGRLWANNNEIRQELGWAVLPEIGFEMRFNASANESFLTRLNGIVLQLQADGRWRSVTKIPSRNGATISRFVVNPEATTSAGRISVSWEADGSDFVQIAFVDTADTNNTVESLYDSMPLSGSLEWVIPETVTGNIQVTLWLVNHVNSTSPMCCYDWLTSLSRQVIVSHDIDVRHETYAAYQTFEYGFMLWREDTGDVRVFYNNGTWQLYQEHLYGQNSDNQWEIPQGCFEVVNAFGKIWGSYGDVREALGCATSAEQGYQLTINSETNANFRYSLPDGRTVYLSANAWGF